MALRALTVQQKIEGIERLIRDLRGSSPETVILAEIAKDLRARPKSGEALDDLRAVLREAVAARGGQENYPTGHVQRLGNRLMRWWPTIEQALEEFEAKEASNAK